MSEYQYVEFRAVDAPLTDKQLDFAERQSSRAEVSRWSLSVDYAYSSFRGDVNGLLRRGYDVYLQYTNYGCREIKLRLPDGIPVDRKTWSQYVDGDRIKWKKDRKSEAGILSLFPFFEERQEVWEFDDYLSSAVSLRDRLMRGDLRPLYVLWVCGASDDYVDPEGMIEPSVPHGIREMSSIAAGFMHFFGLDPLLFSAAAEGVPDEPVASRQHDRLTQWLESLDELRSKTILRDLLGDDTLGVKAKVLSEIRKSAPSVIWPTANMMRTLDDLRLRTEELRSEHDAKLARRAEAARKRKAKKAEEERKKRMKEMVKSPKKWLKQAEELVEARGTDNYKAAADLLADLGEAVGGEKGKSMVRKHAAHLTESYPTLNHLKSSLRKRGLLG